ncbi:MAG: bifunctional phosphoglucose/phosphomannose isomerase [Bacteroidetes bacterium]|nr:bifunctional phosphoglucose/phosphomannose isomerase [Bacteroidota bacterium]
MYQKTGLLQGNTTEHQPIEKFIFLCRFTSIPFIMYDLIKEFPSQLLRAVEIGEQAKFKNKAKAEIKNIVVCGLGASGFGGNLLSELFRGELKIPVIVNKSYFLPAFVDESTLLILSSYSGNTEETISCANDAAKKGMSAVCITSGGTLATIADKQNWNLIKIPAGFPPRSALGYSTVQLFFVLKHFGLIGDEFKKSILRTASFLEMEQNKIMADAEFLAGKLLNKILILYTEDKYESTALRLKQQINENSKMHCWYNVVPEMNHNELVGWREPINNIAVIILRSLDEYHRNTARILFKKDVVLKVSENVYEINAKGSDTFEKHFYLVHIGDWLSYHLAMLQGYDPIEIDVLVSLKSHMSSIQ